MRFYVLVLIVLAPLFSWSQENRWTKGKAYLDLEDGDKISVFTKPGFNYTTCATDKGDKNGKTKEQREACKAVAWPDNTVDDIEIISDEVKEFTMWDPERRINRVFTFVKVRVKYERTVNGVVNKQNKIGWIDAGPLRKKKVQSFYGNESKPKKVCPPGKKSSSPAYEIKKTLEPLNSAISNTSVAGVAELIAPKIGACVITPKQTTFKAGNPYDNYAYPAVSKSVPNITKEDGTPLTREDMVAIDAWARTLISEQGVTCFRRGLHYPMSVLKVGANRLEAVKTSPGLRKQYINGDHIPLKSDMAKLATTGNQFNVWNHKHSGQANPTLPQALCPPSNSDKAFYVGRKPLPHEARAWQNAVLMATEAVVFPKKFAARTAEVKQQNYTSGMSSFYGMKKQFASIEGRKIDDQSCVQLWSK